MDFNNQLVLICGLSASGKSASLRNIRNQNGWLYANTESGKRLPFRNDFVTVNVSDPIEDMRYVFDSMKDDNAKGLIIDSLTFLMDMYESQYVLTANNTMKAWSDYNQYFKNMMQLDIAPLNKPVIITAHVQDILDEKNMEMKTMVPIKGALKGTGVEAFFSCIVYAKKVSIKDLEPYHNELLNITEEDIELGFKHVFQTRITAKTTGERIRSPMGLFDKSMTYIDNDAQLLLDYLNEYYK